MYLLESALDEGDLRYIRGNKMITGKKIFRNGPIVENVIEISDTSFDKIERQLLESTDIETARSRSFALRMINKAVRLLAQRDQKEPAWSIQTRNAAVLAIAASLFTYAPTEGDRLLRLVK